MKIEYRKCGDYLIPDFELPSKPVIGKYGKMRHSYLRNHKESLFTALMMQDKLNSHLEEIDRSAQEMYDRLMNQLKEQYGITEKLKAENQMLWVGRMNNIIACAEEIVVREVVYV